MRDDTPDIDPRAIERLVRRVGERFGDAELARDAVHEALLRLLVGDGVGRVENVEAWTYRVGTRIAIDRLRHRRRGERLVHGLGAASGDERVAPALDRAIEEAEAFAALVARLLLASDARRAACLLLHECFGVSWIEMARRTGHAPGTLRQWASRTKRAARAFGEEVALDAVDREWLGRLTTAVAEADVSVLFDVLEGVREPRMRAASASPHGVVAAPAPVPPLPVLGRACPAGPLAGEAGAYVAIERVGGRWRATLRLGAIRLCALERVTDAVSRRRAAARDL